MVAKFTARFIINLRRGSAADCLLEMLVRIPPGAIDVCL